MGRWEKGAWRPPDIGRLGWGGLGDTGTPHPSPMLPIPCVPPCPHLASRDTLGGWGLFLCVEQVGRGLGSSIPGRKRGH